MDKLVDIKVSLNKAISGLELKPVNAVLNGAKSTKLQVEQPKVTTEPRHLPQATTEPIQLPQAITEPTNGKTKAIPFQENPVSTPKSFHLQNKVKSTIGFTDEPLTRLAQNTIGIQQKSALLKAEQSTLTKIGKYAVGVAVTAAGTTGVVNRINRNGVSNLPDIPEEQAKPHKDVVPSINQNNRPLDKSQPKSLLTTQGTKEISQANSHVKDSLLAQEPPKVAPIVSKVSEVTERLAVPEGQSSPISKTISKLNQQKSNVIKQVEHSSHYQLSQYAVGVIGAAIGVAGTIWIANKLTTPKSTTTLPNGRKLSAVAQ